MTILTPRHEWRPDRFRFIYEGVDLRWFRRGETMRVPERKQVIELNGKSSVRGDCIHELVERQVDRDPDAEAVRWHGDRLLYGELESSATSPTNGTPGSPAARNSSRTPTTCWPIDSRTPSSTAGCADCPA
jgi:hypothetical protein